MNSAKHAFRLVTARLVVAFHLVFSTSVSAQSMPVQPGPSAAKPEPKTIVLLGDSLAAGFGLEPSEAFPALLQNKIDEAGWNFTVINAGLSGDTSAGGVRRIDWLL